MAMVVMTNIFCAAVRLIGHSNNDSRNFYYCSKLALETEVNMLVHKKIPQHNIVKSAALQSKFKKLR